MCKDNLESNEDEENKLENYEQKLEVPVNVLHLIAFGPFKFSVKQKIETKMVINLN